MIFLLQVAAGALSVGWAERDTTPDTPVALCGQFHKRISTGVASRLSATALALETTGGDQAVLVSCDLVTIGDPLLPRLRELLAGKLEGLDLRKIVLNATHTHTAPVTFETWYDVTEDGVMKPDAYVTFLLGRLVEAVTEAWRSRAPAGVTYGLGQAVVGYNRRMVYADGRAVMYGGNTGPDFRRVEGYEDHAVETLFFFDAERRLTGVAINLACPSQVVEGANTISADFWDDVRVVLRERHGAALRILAWTGAGGDQSPHPQMRKAAETRMRKLRGNLSETRVIALRIADAVDEALKAVKSEIQTSLPFAHHVEELRLPARKITEAEFKSAKAVVDRLAAIPADKRKSQDISALRWHSTAVERFERPVEHFTMELHVMRLGDVALTTNPFELFIDYGIQMKTRSKATQTFILQLACSIGGYLPTEMAVAGGGYSAIPESGKVGPDGGRILVDRTVEILNGFWK